MRERGEREREKEGRREEVRGGRVDWMSRRDGERGKGRKRVGERGLSRLLILSLELDTGSTFANSAAIFESRGNPIRINPRAIASNIHAFTFQFENANSRTN